MSIDRIDINKIKFGCYGTYSNNYGTNCIYFDIGNASYYFSYKTLVVFVHPKTGFVITWRK